MAKNRAEQGGTGSNRKSGKFKFKKHAAIGAPAAEEDDHFLKRCFIDTGDLDVLRDVGNPRCLIVGRVGSGKSALVKKLADLENHVIEISLYNLALEHIANSQVLQFFLEAGVHLDLFYKALWRHVFTVELIRERYAIHTEADQTSLFQKLWNMIPSNSRKRKQIEYLKTHAGSFWQETDIRIKEATRKTEKELKSSISGTLKGLITLSAGETSKLTEEQKLEVRQRGQEVINQVKIKDLNELFELLKTDILTDEEKSYYIVIDKLDEDWADEPLRYQLIKSLIETIRDFRHVPHVKLAICIRTDLLERVYRTYGGGSVYQEEKIRGLYLELKWTRQQLIDLLDKRIEQLAEDCYTKGVLTHADLLPPTPKKGIAAIDFILDRTFNRPRDVIAFFNYCIGHSEGSPRISKSALVLAEEDYSKDRLKSLADEWQKDYPYLLEFANIFKKRKHQFRLGDISDDEIGAFCLEFLTAHVAAEGSLAGFARQFFNDHIDGTTFRQLVACVFYHVGLLGVKTESYTKVQWSAGQIREIASSELNDETLCAVHKMFWSKLGIKQK